MFSFTIAIFIRYNCMRPNFFNFLFFGNEEVVRDFQGAYESLSTCTAGDKLLNYFLDQLITPC